MRKYAIILKREGQKAKVIKIPVLPKSQAKAMQTIKGISLKVLKAAGVTNVSLKYVSSPNAPGDGIH
jgi:hypothetical protein